ncbi:MAG: hypothetical protein CMO55_21370 [Verrucomicrobiales bacterium]|nr:hypothetical protein [Verrucomicrobiales bacterium]
MALAPKIFAGILAISFSLSVSGHAQEPPVAPEVGIEVIKRWLGTNTGVGSVKIDFTQTRHMKSLKVPIRQDGILWLDFSKNPRRFRWQTGDPAQTIVVGGGNGVLIIRTPGKKFEKKASGESAAPGMASLAHGFPRTLEDFQRKYHILEVRPHQNTYRILARPLGASGRGVETFTYVVERDRHRLLGIEIQLKDGSSVETVFNQVQANVALPAGLFSPDLTGYKETKF